MPPEEEEGSIREALSAAFDADETSPETPPETPPETLPETPPATPPASSGELPPGEVPPTPPIEEKRTPPRAAGKPGEPPAPAAPSEIVEKPPVSWKPTIRETHWAKLPKEVREEVVRREREITTTLSQTADARRFAHRFAEVARPYEHIMRMEGNDPMIAFEGYLKTATILRQGTPHEKASGLAQIIKQFSVDPALLDNALVGILPQPGAAPAPNPADFRDPRLDEMQRQHEEQQQAAASAELQTFIDSGKAEFFPDVEDLMSDILRVAADRNQRMGLQEAYERAIMIHPEVSKVVQQRKEGVSVTARAKAAEAARKKVITGGGAPPPSGVGAGPSVGNLRADIEAAIDAQGSM